MLEGPLASHSLHRSRPTLTGFAAHFRKSSVSLRSARIICNRVLGPVQAAQQCVQTEIKFCLADARYVAQLEAFRPDALVGTISFLQNLQSAVKYRSSRYGSLSAKTNLMV